MMAGRGLPKLAEECGELLQVIGKRLAYYHTEYHPDRGPPLKNRLEDEMADVIAAIWFVAEKEGLGMTYINQRASQKLKQFQDWDEMPDNNQLAIDGGTK